MPKFIGLYFLLRSEESFKTDILRRSVCQGEIRDYFQVISWTSSLQIWEYNTLDPTEEEGKGVQSTACVSPGHNQCLWQPTALLTFQRGWENNKHKREGGIAHLRRLPVGSRSHCLREDQKERKGKVRIKKKISFLYSEMWSVRKERNSKRTEM